MAKFTVCISSVIEREQGFPDYRYIAKSVIDHMGHQAVRNPEDVHTQYNFERVLKAYRHPFYAQTIYVSRLNAY